MKSNNTHVWLMVIAATFFWGANFNAGHAIAGQLSPAMAAGERYIIAIVVLISLRLWRCSAESQLTTRDMAILLGLGLFGVFGFNYAFFAALASTSALNAALIMALSPLLTSLLSAIFLGTPLSARRLLGIGIAFSGVALVITSGQLSVVHLAQGDLWMLLACVIWSLYTVLLKLHVSHIPFMQQARWTIGAGTVLLVALAISQENIFAIVAQQSTHVTLVLTYMALCGTVLAYIFWLRGVQKLGPDTAAIAFNLVPVATLLVNLALGEWPTHEQYAGLLLVFSGVWVATGWRPRWLQNPKAPKKSINTI